MQEILILNYRHCGSARCLALRDTERRIAFNQGKRLAQLVNKEGQP